MPTMVRTAMKRTYAGDGKSPDPREPSKRSPITTPELAPVAMPSGTFRV
jgi:hypothetical protein